MKPIIALILLALTTAAQAGEQVRVYGANSRTLGTITTDSAGSNVYRDDRGRTIGTSTTTSRGVTTFYDQNGNRVGSADDRRPK
jgi:hypothetical protein